MLAQWSRSNLWRKLLRKCFFRCYPECITVYYENKTIMAIVTGGERARWLYKLMSRLQVLISEVTPSHKCRVNILKSYGFINTWIRKITIEYKTLHQVSIADFAVIARFAHFEPQYTLWHFGENVSVADGLVVVVLTSATLITRPKIPKYIWHSEDRASWYILIMKANEMHYFSNLFDKVLYMFRTCPCPSSGVSQTLYTQPYMLVLLASASRRQQN